MEHCLTLDDVAQVSRNPLIELAKIQARFDSGPADFRKEVLRVEERLKQLYELGALAAKRAEHPAQCVEVWKAVSDFSDEALNVLRILKDKHPSSETSAAYELAENYKAAAVNRARLNEEASLCQANPAPPGLFPPMP